MWPVIPVRVYLAAALLIAACGATWWTTATHYRGVIVQMELAATQNELKGWQIARQKQEKALEGYRTDLAAVARKPVRPVLMCNGVPASGPGASGADGASGSGADRPAQRDIGPDIAQCRDELIRLKALIEVVR
jgi:hypothetical protein